MRLKCDRDHSHNESIQKNVYISVSVLAKDMRGDKGHTWFGRVVIEPFNRHIRYQSHPLPECGIINEHLSTYWCGQHRFDHLLSLTCYHTNMLTIRACAIRTMLFIHILPSMFRYENRATHIHFLLHAASKRKKSPTTNFMPHWSTIQRNRCQSFDSIDTECRPFTFPLSKFFKHISIFNPYNFPNWLLSMALVAPIDWKENLHNASFAN